MSLVLDKEEERRRKRRESNERWKANNPERHKEVVKRSYEKHKETRLQKAKEWQKANPERCAAATARYREANLDSVINTQLKTKYNITLQERDEMLAAQDQRCAICRKHTDKWMVDHCHDSKRVRGILCFSCNVLLGHAKDNVETLTSAAEYLRKGSENGGIQANRKR